MTLSSASTDAQVEAAYDDNAFYDQGTGNITSAQLFAQACRLLQRRYASSISAGGASTQRRVDLLKDQELAAVKWLQANDPNQNAGGMVQLNTQDARL